MEKNQKINNRGGGGERGGVTIIRDLRVLPVNKDALCSCTLNVDALEKMLK